MPLRAAHPLAALCLLLASCSRATSPALERIGVAREASIATCTTQPGAAVSICFPASSATIDDPAVASVPGPAQATATPILWTVPTSGHLTDVVFLNGGTAVPLALDDDSNFGQWDVNLWPGGQGPSGEEWAGLASNGATDQCGTGALAAHASWAMSSLPSWCTWLPLPIAAGDTFSADFQDNGGHAFGAMTVSLIVGP